MEERNNTQLTEFVLLGITNLPELKGVVFGMILTFYIINLFGNISIVTVVIREAQLHMPMYFLLVNLSFMDIGLSSVTVPKMLAILLLEKKTISFVGCLTQLNLLHFFGVTEGMLLASMSYDRYVAICHPLRYVVIMNDRVWILLASFSWAIGFLNSLFHTILTSKLLFCSSNQIKYFFCDFKPLMKLACSNTQANEGLVTIVFGSLAVITISLILLSYVFIAFHLLKMKSSKDRQKAFSTCASHLTLVFFCLGTAMITYSRTSTNGSLEKDRMASILFTVITPTLNPFVYTLRNKDVKRALKRLLCGKAV